jgi:hypothetical protein
VEGVKGDVLALVRAHGDDRVADAREAFALAKLDDLADENVALARSPGRGGRAQQLLTQRIGHGASVRAA